MPYGSSLFPNDSECNPQSQGRLRHSTITLMITSDSSSSFPMEISQQSWGLLINEIHSLLFQLDSVCIPLEVSIVTLMITSDKLLQNSIENAYFFIIPYEIFSHSPARSLVVTLMILWQLTQSTTKNVNLLINSPQNLYSLLKYPTRF